MSATLSSQERATVILSVGIFASFALIATILLGSALFVLGQGGSAAYESLRSYLHSAPTHVARDR